MPWVLEALLLLLALALLFLLIRPRPEGLDWARAKLKDLLDWSEVEGALNALSRREAELKEAFQAPHLLPETQTALSRALIQVQEERKRLLALLESLAAERALLRGGPREAQELRARLQDLREVLASLRREAG
ncbi:hypothetical protein QT17_11555 [Thermus sp. 2.9]|uniref:hypothetical protein n=1 Tax=Thermus sp. (strain 2.9) TaxID=1577051 RepID=UPI0005433749|nr:hypothetical protein [Thermus sp. 2.9]KHG64587.1 hypothetical protein QT17_11555 [Thermus sp. 2.9]